MKLSSRYIEALKGEADAPPYFFALYPPGWAYCGLMRARALMYRSGLFRTRRLPCKVVSVGNLTAGGTGKTPMVVYLCRRMMEMGLSVAVLTRGYKGRKEGETLIVSDGKGAVVDQMECGDEPALISRLVPGVPVVMGSDRYGAGMLAVERFTPDVVVLDDGFQHMALERDLDILLMDALHPFGNGKVVPAGYLREPSSAAARADIVVLTRSDRVSNAGIDSARRAASDASGGRPVVTAVHAPGGLKNVWSGEDIKPEYLANKSVFAFAGIADPASLTLILKSLGAKIAGLKGFPDHYVYKEVDLASLTGTAFAAGADLLITTEKDAVKLNSLPKPDMEAFAVGVELVITGGEDVLDGLLRERVTKA
jgi:tetraacyldisaccharide 4'-kinase